VQNLLPRNTLGLENDDGGTGFGQSTLFVAGDVRANENLALNTLHTLFMRQHNRLVDELSIAHPSWSQEEPYQVIDHAGASPSAGDANLDGVVADDDVTILGAFYASGVRQPSWARGDFDYNGFVDDDDVTLLGALYDPLAAPIAASAANVAASVAGVPEPSCLLLVAVAGGAVLASRRRIALWHPGAE
jgi:hypothetical protein